MPVHTIQPGLLDIVASLMTPLRRRASAPRNEPASGTTAEDTRIRRDFMRTMMAENPDAFASELDVGCMMHLYPGRF